MNLKPCIVERLAFISLGFGRDTQVGKSSLIYYDASVDVGRIQFLYGMRRAVGSHQNPRALE